MSTPGERMQQLLKELGEDEFRRRLYATTLTNEPTDRAVARAMLVELQERRTREATETAHGIARDGASASRWTARWTFGILLVALATLIVQWCRGPR